MRKEIPEDLDVDGVEEGTVAGEGEGAEECVRCEGGYAEGE
jgi:hypothetical protein